MKEVALLVLLLSSYTIGRSTPKFCDIRDVLLTNKCYEHEVPTVNNRSSNLYVIYDVNPVEGFNLRRDVYIRMATFMRSLRKKARYKTAKLVLPPFSNMFHWRSRHLNQERVFWRHFFDLASLREFTEVLDFPEFFTELDLDSKTLIIDEVYRLQNYDDMFENGIFVDKFELAPCKHFSEREINYYGYYNITHRLFRCVNFQGGAKLLRKMLYKHRTIATGNRRIVLILNTETVLHDSWGTSVYWEARRSMRFSKALQQLADHFRYNFLASSPEVEQVQRPALWHEEKPYREAQGGPFIGAHLRRADFLYGREKTTPSLLSAATQLKRKLKELNLTTVFLASDCTGLEFSDLKSFMRPFRLVKFAPASRKMLTEIKDGGLAIIDQIIASHARFFIGTYESTFTFRIYEEREILGFDQSMTYNTFCKRDDLSNCEKNSVWTIVY